MLVQFSKIQLRQTCKIMRAARIFETKENQIELYIVSTSSLKQFQDDVSFHLKLDAKYAPKVTLLNPTNIN